MELHAEFDLHLRLRRQSQLQVLIVDAQRTTLAAQLCRRERMLRERAGLSETAILFNMNRLLSWPIVANDRFQ